MPKSYSCQHDHHNECQEVWCDCWCHPDERDDDDYELADILQEAREQDYLAEFLDAFPEYEGK